jgi:hypothetical protein
MELKRIPKCDWLIETIVSEKDDDDAEESVEM